jgi:hypothetical protein
MDLYSFILAMLVLCICLIGLYLHVKIIRISKKEKEMTWKLDITNSCILIFNFTHSILMENITYIVPNLYTHTGEWFCYASKVVSYYGYNYTIGHSMIVSILKYILIVHWKKSRDFGKENVKEVFFWINIFYSLFMILIHLSVEPEFFSVWDGFARIDRCLGDPKNNWGPDSNRTQTKLHNICQNFIEPSPDKYFAYTIHIIRTGVCWVHIVFWYLVLWNVFEVVAYFRIFATIQRY